MKNTSTLTLVQKNFRRFLKHRGSMFLFGDERSREDMKGLEKGLQITLRKKFRALVNRYPFEKFTMRTFAGICGSEGVKVCMEKPRATALGMYVILPDHMKLPDHLTEANRFRQPHILIDPDLTGRRRLMCAAHELSHHWLHSKLMRAGTLYFEENDGEKVPESSVKFYRELEADIFASMILAVGREVRDA